jgi:hypothetical protein
MIFSSLANAERTSTRDSVKSLSRGPSIWSGDKLWKRRKADSVPAAPAVSVQRVATAEETAARMATLTVPERELWEWGRKQEPMKVGCILGSYVIGVDLDLVELYRIQQHTSSSA